jgi:O-antigen/teichoic acid export membrane protein
MSQLKELLGDTAIYGIGSFFLKATQILILPLIIFYLKTDEFGRLDYFLSIKNILIILYGYGVLTSIFKYSDYNQKLDKSPFNGFLVVLLIVVLSTVIIVGLIIFLPNIFTFAEDLIYVHLISSFGAFLTIPLGVLRQRKMPKGYIFVSTIYTLLFIGISYVFVLYTSLSYKSILLAHTLAALIAFISGAFLVKKYILFSYSPTLFKKMFNFGFSILLNSLSFIIILSLTRFVLKLNGTFEDVGLLGMATRLSLFVGALLIAPFNLAWLPFVSANVNKDGFKNTLNSVFRIFTWVGLFFCLTLEFVAIDFFLLIENKEYLPSIKHTLPFSLSHFILGYYFIFSAGIYLSGKIKQYRIIAITTVAFTVVLYLLLFNYINIYSVSYITLLSFSFAMILAFYFGNNTLKIKVFKSSNLYIVLFYTIAFIIIKALPDPITFSATIFGFKIFLLMLLFLFHVILEKYLLKKNNLDVP